MRLRFSKARVKAKPIRNHSHNHMLVFCRSAYAAEAIMGCNLCQSEPSSSLSW